MTLQAKLQQLQALLVGIGGDDVYHYTAKNKADRYIVWAEDGEASGVQANNKKAHQAIEGTIDLFTRNEFDSWVDEIQAALNEAEISFSLNSIQYEEETDYIHYEWIFEVV